jgi:hypothetical protein
VDWSSSRAAAVAVACIAPSGTVDVTEYAAPGYGFFTETVICVPLLVTMVCSSLAEIWFVAICVPATISFTPVMNPSPCTSRRYVPLVPVGVAVAEVMIGMGSKSATVRDPETVGVCLLAARMVT